MPIFEFRCLDCGEIFEVLSMRGADTESPRCPACGTETVDRVLSRAGYTMGEGSRAAGDSGPQVQSRSCAGGSCASAMLPGHTK